MIKGISAIEVFDSRGEPTVEAKIETEAGEFRAIVPSGASTGKHEAVELRDNEKAYFGKGVGKAVANINLVISRMLIGKDETNQRELDQLMIDLDGTENKSRLGANAILAVSMALARAGAFSKGIPLYAHIAELAKNKRMNLPCPALNIINGGRHAANELDIQEYMILPVGAKSFREAMRIASETYHMLKRIIEERYGKNATNVGDEGGFAPPLRDPEEPLRLIIEALEKTDYLDKVRIGLDIAASEFYSNGKYNFQSKKLEKEELFDFYKSIIEKYPILSIEDPFEEDDFESFSEITEGIASRKGIQIVGDDLLVTNIKRIEKAIKMKSCNTLLLKLNQIGTVSESIEAANMAFSAGWKVMVSHRSGDSEDSFIADLAVGIGAQEIKSGAPCRSERLAKYNQLIRIENDKEANEEKINFYSISF